MNLGEAKKKAISLIGEYSNNGIPVSDGQNADYLLLGNRLADMAQKEIAAICKIPARKTIVHNPIPNLLGSNFEISQHTDSDVVFSSKGAKSYYFEVDGQGIIEIEESLNDVWTNLKTIEVPNTITEFTAYKGNLNPSSNSNTIRIRFTGNYVYNIRNVALYGLAFPTDNDVQPFTQYIRYALPSDIHQPKDIKQLKREYSKEYIWEGNAISVKFDTENVFEIEYFRFPTTITSSTQDTYEFEVSQDGQEAIPFFMGAHMIIKEDQVVGTTLLNEYQGRLGNLKPTLYYGVETIKNTNGW